MDLAHVDSEIEKLVDSLTGANNVLLSYVNVKIAELDGLSLIHIYVSSNVNSAVVSGSKFQRSPTTFACVAT